VAGTLWVACAVKFGFARDVDMEMNPKRMWRLYGVVCVRAGPRSAAVVRGVA
jgi:hypothetical protein